MLLVIAMRGCILTKEGYAYVHCLGRRSLAPQGDAGSYRCESLSVMKHKGCSQYLCHKPSDQSDRAIVR